MLEAPRRPSRADTERCVSCVVVSVGLVAVLAVLLSPVSRFASLVVLGLGGASTYLRGSVIPGLPRLVERLLPDPRQPWFGPAEAVQADTFVDADPERVLHDAGVLISSPKGGRCFSAKFRRAWTHELRHLPRPGAVDVEPLVGDAVGATTHVDRVDDVVSIRVDGRTRSWWPSRTAFRADAAAARYLESTYSHWDSLPVSSRTAVLAGIRLWLHRCPDCGGRLELGDEPVESRRSATPVLALTCRGCGARVLETPTDE